MEAEYPMIVRSWRTNWEQLVPFLAFPTVIWRIVYMTNAVESLHFQLRKVLKTKGQFPTAESALKRLYLALTPTKKKWRVLLLIGARRSSAMRLLL